MSPRIPWEDAAVGEALAASGRRGTDWCALVTVGAVHAGAVETTVIPVAGPQILLLVHRETQETTRSSGPGALQPRDPAQDLPKPSPPSA